MLDLKRTLALLLLAAVACAQTPVQGWTLLIRQSAGNVWATQGRSGHLHISTVNPFSMAGCIRAGRAQQLISFVSGPCQYMTPAEWVHYNSPNTDPDADFSILDTLESYRANDGRFTLKLVRCGSLRLPHRFGLVESLVSTPRVGGNAWRWCANHYCDDRTRPQVWPNHDGENEQTWRQSNNPVTDEGEHGGVTDYAPIDVHFTTQGWGGLEHGGSASLLDGTVNAGNWFYAVSGDARGV